MSQTPHEVFRFATVRGPQKAITSQTAPIFTNYSHVPNSGRVGTFYDDVKSAVDQNKTQDEIRLLADNFRTGSSSYPYSSDLFTDFSGFDNIYQILKNVNPETSLSSVQSQISELLDFSLFSTSSGNDKILRVWDNLFANSILLDNPSLLEDLSHTLNLVNLLSKRIEAGVLTLLPSDLALAKKARVLLPQIISDARKRKNDSVSSQDTSSQVIDKKAREKEKISKLSEEWHLIHNISNEINSKYNCYVQSLREREQPEPELDNDGNITNAEDLKPIDPRFFDTKTIPLTEDSSKFVREIIRCEKTEKVLFDSLEKKIAERLDRVSSELVKYIKPYRKVVLSGGTILTESNDIVSEDLDRDSATPSGGSDSCTVKSLGIADLRIVEQELLYYAPGEIAHIENVLKGEFKERATRRFQRTEETNIYEKIKEEENEKDTQTTDRYEMQKESSKVKSLDMQLDVGVTMSAEMGPVQLSATTGFSLNSSTTQSDRSAVNYAKSVTERARQRIYEKVREQRTINIIEEFEETNKHGVDNKTGTDHVVGLYRWVDKIYQCQVKNYGKRLMFEFIVPEPAVFHLKAMSENPVDGLSIKEPIAPSDGVIVQKYTGKKEYLFSYTDVNSTNYKFWAAAYGVTDIEPYPQTWQTISATIKSGASGSASVSSAGSIDQLKIPDGYVAYEAYLASDHISGGADSARLTVQVGRTNLQLSHLASDQKITLDYEGNLLPVSWSAYDQFIFSATLCVLCIVTNEEQQRWQINTYKKIMEGYKSLKAQYDNQLASLQVRAGIQIKGNNPLYNREIEKKELKKHCIQMMADDSFYDMFGAINGNDDCPQILRCAAIEQGEVIKFIEHAFDWNLMTYIFYPYFWARKSKWISLYNLENTDPIFTGFLQSGAARVIVPVRQGYEEAVQTALASGQLIYSPDLPIPDDELSTSIAWEMLHPVSTCEGDPWEIRLPTNLAILQCGSACVDESDPTHSGLPDYR